MKHKNRFFDNTIFIFFALYLVLLTWVILFKMIAPWDLGLLRIERTLNTVPFKGIRYDYFNSVEFWGNILAFLPFGIYTGYYSRKYSFWLCALLPLLLSLLYEALQYIFAIGRADITDTILNSLGGLLGTVVYCAMKKLFKEKTKAALAYGNIALGTPCILLFSILILANL